MPAWALGPLAVIALVAAPVAIYASLSHMWTESEASKALNETKEELQQTQSQLKTIQSDLSAARDDYNEYVKHTSEAGLDFHRDANMTVKYYASDGCIYVLRSARGAWLRDPSRMSQPAAPPPGGLDGGLRSTLRNMNPAGLVDAFRVIPAVYRVEGDGPPDAGQQKPPLRGNCLNPHPGKYTSRNGRKNGCWLQVWRKWADGCEHYQWFNTCTTYWETAAGKPVVYWTTCVH